MKTSRACTLLITGLVCALSAFADEAWQAKSPADWNEKDIRQILERSPWAHRVSVLLVRPDGEAAPCLGSKGPCAREDTFHSPNNSSSNVPGGRASPDLVTQVRNTERQQEYTGAADIDRPERSDGVAGIAVVRWASARTVRDALARLVPPSGKRMDAEELAQLAPLDAYVMYVDLRVPLADVSHISQNGVLTEQMARRSALVLKSSGQRIPAVRVAAAPLPEFDDRKELALAAYYIFFPKGRGARATLPARETEVRFECPLAPVAIRADFRLSRMTREGLPDF
jgi:hypothetical protein